MCHLHNITTHLCLHRSTEYHLMLLFFNRASLNFRGNWFSGERAFPYPPKEKLTNDSLALYESNK